MRREGAFYFMAVVISEQGGSCNSGPKRFFRRLRDADAMAKIVAGLTAGSLAIGGTFLYLGFREYKAMADARAEWVQVSDLASGAGSGAPAGPEPFIEIPVGRMPGYEFEASSGQAVYKPDDALYKAVDLAALQALNPNVSGYIYIPGTRIDYPILKEQSVKDYFYIDHNIYNRPDKYGSVFELSDEERGGPDSPVNWIFGHHMSSGSMFSDLYKFLEDGLAGTPVYIYRDGYRCEYQAFAACTVDMDDLVYDFDGYERGSEDYRALLERMCGISKLPGGMADPPGADLDVTVLSTCYGGAGTRNRLVVLLYETRRAVTQEYYDSLADVYQYGGDPSPLDPDEVPGGTSYVDPDGNLADFETTLEGAGAGASGIAGAPSGEG